MKLVPTIRCLRSNLYVWPCFRPWNKGLRYILHTKVDLATRFPQHPSVCTWHTQPQSLIFPIRGLAALILEALSCTIHTFSFPLFLSFLLSFSLISCPFSLSLPLLLFLPPHNNKPVSIYFNLAWIDSCHVQRRIRGQKQSSCGQERPGFNSSWVSAPSIIIVNSFTIKNLWQVWALHFQTF